MVASKRTVAFQSSVVLRNSGELRSSQVGGFHTLRKTFLEEKNNKERNLDAGRKQEKKHSLDIKHLLKVLKSKEQRARVKEMRKSEVAQKVLNIGEEESGSKKNIGHT